MCELRSEGQGRTREVTLARTGSEGLIRAAGLRHLKACPLDKADGDY